MIGVVASTLKLILQIILGACPFIAVVIRPAFLLLIELVSKSQALNKLVAFSILFLYPVFVSTHAVRILVLVEELLPISIS